MQASPSVQAAPFGRGGFEQRPVSASHEPTRWHWSCAVHVTKPVDVQTPAWQASPVVHALPSLHGAPFVFGGFVHVPVMGLHVPGSWHWSSAVHVTGFAPVQLPDWQGSVCVQRSPSLHGLPFVLAGFEHTPVDGLHAPASWHWSCAVHTTGFAPAHAPFWQVSVCVQALPSEHGAPFVLAGFEHVPVDGLHVPGSWHWSSALQATGFAPVHVPD